jgi:hypothetical protein
VNITFNTRRFYPDELRIIKAYNTQKEKEDAFESSKREFYHLLLQEGAIVGYVLRL